MYGESSRYKGRMTKENFLNGSMLETLTLPGYFIEGEEVWLRIGPDDTQIGLRMAIPVESTTPKLSVDEVVDKYVYNFDVRGFGEDNELAPEDEEELMTKVLAMKTRRKNLKADEEILYDVVNGPEKIKTHNTSRMYFAFRLGAEEDGDGLVLLKENLLDLVQKVDNSGGNY